MTEGPRIVEFEPNRDASVLARLSETSDFVEKNAISAIAIVMTLSDGSMRSCWSDVPNYTMMIGAIERTKRRMIEKCEGGEA